MNSSSRPKERADARAMTAMVFCAMVAGVSAALAFWLGRIWQGVAFGAVAIFCTWLAAAAPAKVRKFLSFLFK